MAVILPYPDMDFVPLDILTAAEQDQLVANIEYLAGLFPLSVDNIDFGTFDSITAYNSASGTQSVGMNESINVNNYSSKSGSNLSISGGGVAIGQGISKILVSANVFYDFATETEYVWCSLSKNGVEIPRSTSIANAEPSGYTSVVCSPLLVEVAPGDIIRMRNLRDGSVIRNNSTWMTVIKIG